MQWGRSTAGLFMWCHYPLENHTREACDRFFRQITSGSSVDDGSIGDMADTLYKMGTVDLVAHRLPGSGPGAYWPTTPVRLMGAAGVMDGAEPLGPEFERSSATSILIISDKRYTRLGNPDSVAAILHLFGTFASHFLPTFGFGHADFGAWWAERHQMPPPEGRVWPFNVFDLLSYDRVLMDRIRALAPDNAGEWTFRILRGRTAILHLRDMRTPWESIGPEVTTLLLGEEGERLVPIPECGVVDQDLCSLPSSYHGIGD